MSATLSVVAVVGVATWQIGKILETKNTALHATATATAGVSLSGATDSSDLSTQLKAGTATSSTPEEISQIGTNAIGAVATYYALATQNTPYTPELGAQIIATVSPTVAARVPYQMYDAHMIATDADTSLARRDRYRTDLQTSLKPLTYNTRYELDLYNEYVHTRNTTHLEELKVAAHNYRTAASAAADVTVPANATLYHVGILNAMQEFSATLDMMADNVADPITSLALLKSYNQAESDMMSSFSALHAYFQHTQS